MHIIKRQDFNVKFISDLAIGTVKFSGKATFITGRLSRQKGVTGYTRSNTRFI